MGQKYAIENESVGSALIFQRLSLGSEGTESDVAVWG